MRFAQAWVILFSSLSFAAEVVEVSAPIFPKVFVLYAQEGTNYPSTQAAKEQLVTDAALEFEALLSECAANDPNITLQSGSTALTTQQLIANYNAVAQCAYETYTAKPYWIPQLIDDVDICEQVMGTGWALLSESDIDSFTAADFTFFEDTLTAASSGTSFWGSFYFSLKAFVRASDGSIQQGDLSASVTGPRVTPLSFPMGWDATRHYEGALSLRCIRRTQTP